MLGERIRERRQALRYKLKDVAAAVGVPTTTYAAWEYGKTTPSPDKLRKIAEFLETSTDFLTGASNSIKPDGAILERDLAKILASYPITHQGVTLSAEERIMMLRTLDMARELLRTKGSDSLGVHPRLAPDPDEDPT